MSLKDKLHIIAEAGTNHNGDLKKAIALADIARNANADSVKYQIIYPYGLYLPGDYEYGHYDIKEVIKIRTDGMLEDSDYEVLAEHCKEIGIPFTASVFDERGLDLLTKFKPPYVKIASCDLNNLRFLRQVAEKGIKLVISTGMSTLSDVEKSVKAVTETGFEDLVLLHCVSVYPAFLEQTNLSFIEQLKKEFGYPVGFSDHTGSSVAACLALAKGATWFEKHFTEDKTQHGFDHKYAIDADEMKQYVQDIHNAAAALKPADKKLTEDEIYTRKRARRSIYASRDLPPGHTLTNDDVLVVRPEGLLDADQIDEVIGKKLITELKQYDPFSLDVLK